MFKPSVVILAIALLLGPAIVAEAGVQALIRIGRLPEAPTSNAYADVSIANLVRAGRPDVLVIGTSSIRNALVPDVLEELVERDTGNEIRVHSVAIGVLSHNDQRVLVEGLARHGLLAALSEPMPRTFEDRGQRLLENGWYNGPPSSAGRLDGTLVATLEQLPDGVEHQPQVRSDFVALVEELRAHGTTVIPVAVPYSPPLIEALVERDPAWRAELESGYASLSTAADVGIVEIPEYGEDWEPQWQRDHRHLSRKGARIVTEQLWDMPQFREAVRDGLASAD